MQMNEIALTPADGNFVIQIIDLRRTLQKLVSKQISILTLFLMYIHSTTHT